MLYPFFVLICQWICLSCVLCVGELFGETISNIFGCGRYLLLNVMDMFSVCCACDPSVHLDVHSIGFVCVCRRVSPHLTV